MPISESSSLLGTSQWTRAQEYALSPSLKENKRKRWPIVRPTMPLNLESLNKNNIITRELITPVWVGMDVFMTHPTSTT
jgi:hypothetical protein